MAHYYTIARPYARAVFNSALKHNKLQDWQTILQVLAASIETKKLSGIIGSPRFSDEKWLEWLSKTYADVLPNMDQVFTKEIYNFLRLLLEYRRLYVLPDIFVLYTRLVAMQQGILVAHVFSAYAIKSEQKKKLAEVLEKKFKTKIDLNCQIDKNLLGGMVICAKNFVIDGSVRSHLRRLKNSLMR